MTDHVRTPEQRYADALGSETATCARCLFYHHGEEECRRRPPPPMNSAMIPDEADFGLTRWPHVGLEDWCGEFREGDAGTFDGVLGRAPE